MNIEAFTLKVIEKIAADKPKKRKKKGMSRMSKDTLLLSTLSSIPTVLFPAIFGSNMHGRSSPYLAGVGNGLVNALFSGDKLAKAHNLTEDQRRRMQSYAASSAVLPLGGPLVTALMHNLVGRTWSGHRVEKENDGKSKRKR